MRAPKAPTVWLSLLALAGGVWLIWLMGLGGGEGWSFGPKAASHAEEGVDLRATAILPGEMLTNPETTPAPKSDSPQRQPVGPIKSAPPPQWDPADPVEAVPSNEDGRPLIWSVLDEYGRAIEGASAHLFLRSDEKLKRLALESDSNGQWSIPARYSQPPWRFVRVESRSRFEEFRVLAPIEGQFLPTTALVRRTPLAGLRVTLSRKRRTSRTPFCVVLSDGTFSHLSPVSKEGETTLYVKPGRYTWGWYVPRSLRIDAQQGGPYPLRLFLRAGVTQHLALQEPRWEEHTYPLRGVLSDAISPGVQWTDIELLPEELWGAPSSFVWNADAAGHFSIRSPLPRKPRSEPEWATTPISLLAKRGDQQDALYAASPTGLWRLGVLESDRRITLGTYASQQGQTNWYDLSARNLSVLGLNQPWVESALQSPTVALHRSGRYLLESFFGVGTWSRCELDLLWVDGQFGLHPERDLGVTKMRGATQSYVRTILQGAPDLRWTLQPDQSAYRSVSVDLRVRQGQALMLPFVRTDTQRRGRLHWTDRPRIGQLGVGARELDVSRADLAMDIAPRKISLRCQDSKGRSVPFAMVQAQSGSGSVQVGHADARGELDLFVLGQKPILLHGGPGAFAGRLRIESNQALDRTTLTVPSEPTRLRLESKLKPKAGPFSVRIESTSDDPRAEGWRPPPWVEGPLEPDGSFEAVGLPPGEYRITVRGPEKTLSATAKLRSHRETTVAKLGR